MEKPNSMSIKEWLIKKMSLSLVVSERVIDSVIGHQFETALQAMKVNNSIEFSGFGKFVYNEKKALKEIKKLNSLKNAYIKTIENPESSLERIAEARVRLISVNDKINSLSNKAGYEN